MGDGYLPGFEGEYQERIHSLPPSGHIWKGCSIANKSQSFLPECQAPHSQDKKGFLASSKRFPSTVNLISFKLRDSNSGDFVKKTSMLASIQTFMDRCSFVGMAGPSPCQYLSHGQFDNFTPSFSVKGSGGLACKAKKRAKIIFSSAPGPGIYSVSRVLTTRKDFGTSGMRVFAPPVAEQRYRTNGIPAPNTYHIKTAKVGKANNVTADAVFKSALKRLPMSIAEKAKFPSPDKYTVKDQLQHASAKVPYSCFKSQSKRVMVAKPPAYPGPGHYRPNEVAPSANCQILPRKHYLAISAPAMRLPQPPPLPGPGSYEIVDYDGPAKQHMTGSAFISASDRWNSYMPSGVPGPGHYRPSPVKKQSFIYNIAYRWL